MTEVIVALGLITAAYLVGLPSLLFGLANRRRAEQQRFAEACTAAGMSPEANPTALPGPDAVPYGFPLRYSQARGAVTVGARVTHLDLGNQAYTTQLWASGAAPALRFGVEAGLPHAADTGDPALDAVLRAGAPLDPGTRARLDAPTRELLGRFLALPGATLADGAASVACPGTLLPDDAPDTLHLLASLVRALAPASPAAGATPGSAASESATRLADLARTDPIPDVRARAAAALATLLPDPAPTALAAELAASPEPLVALPCAAALGDLPRVLAAGSAPGAPAALAARLLTPGIGPRALTSVAPPEAWLDWLAARISAESAHGWALGSSAPDAHIGPLLELAAKHGDLRLTPALTALSDDPQFARPERASAALAAIRARAAPALAGAVAVAVDDPTGQLGLAGEAGRLAEATPARAAAAKERTGGG